MKQLRDRYENQDDATTFPTREVTWDEQPMVAIRLPDQRETAWILVRPSIWERIVQALQHLREPEPDENRAPIAATPLPDVLPPQMQQRVESPAWTPATESLCSLWR